MSGADPTMMAVRSNGDTWIRWGNQFGWSLQAFSYGAKADFIGEDDQLIQVTRYMKDTIDKHIEGVVDEVLAPYEER